MKKNMIIIVLLVILLISISFNFINANKAEMKVLTQIYDAVSQCKQIPLTIGNNTVTLIAAECISVNLT